ncbi:helix-turn-helix domain-containing protein [Nocardiopsis sp. NPDC006938]|uniref:helix-turn-helix domain-containing protein n=1 Tax=Nocardiopsis sp. NPDC006938 TaxID=3364337 RepID=UPI003697DB36
MSSADSPHQRAMSATVRVLMERTRLPGGGRTTVTELAHALGEKQPTLSRKMTNSRSWSLENLFEVADHFGVEPSAVVRMVSEELEHQERMERAASS